MTESASERRNERAEKRWDETDFQNPEDASTKLFDLRYLIGALFVVYGVILTIAGFFTGDQNDAKANGININLWLGLAMLVLGLFFLAWAKTRPLRVGHASALAEAEAGGTGGPGRAPEGPAEGSHVVRP